MGWKLALGSFASRTLDAVLSNSRFPLLREFPRGANWTYDVCRFAGTRQLSTIFDVGANEGQTALHLAQFFPSAQIHSFEPVADNFSKLHKAIARQKNVIPHNKAIGSKREAKEIHLYAHPGLHSFMTGATIAPSLNRTELVQVDTVDVICADLDIHHIDILKMDVQGWEPEVLKGADRMLPHISFIFTEVGFETDVADMVPFSEIHGTLAKRNFRLCSFYEFNRWGDQKQWCSFANALYINRAFTPPPGHPTSN